MVQYTIEDGLPSSQIYTVLEDKNGMMWFGTDKGLVRFDGYQFKVFNPSEVNGSSEIWDLAEDKEGRIWCSTFYNALYFWKDQFHLAKIQALDFPKKVSKYSINKKGNDYVWSQEPKLFFEIKNTEVGTSLLKREDFDGFLERFKPRFVYFLKEMNQTKWFAFQLNSGFLIVKQKEEQVELFSEIKFGDETAHIFYRPFIMEDETILFFSKDKVFHFDFKRLQAIPIKDVFGEELQIFQNYEYGKTGLFYTDKGCRVLNWNMELLNGFDFLNSIEINTLYEDSRGNFWICTPSSGVYFLSQKARNSVTIPIPSKTPKDKATSFSIDKEQKVWFGLNTGNLLKMNRNYEFTEIPIHIPNNGRLERTRIHNILIDNKNNLHVTYDSGLLLYILSDRLKDQAFSLYSKSKGNQPLSKILPIHSPVYSDSKGKSGIWGVQTGSLKCYDLYPGNEAWAGCSGGVFNFDFNTFPPTISRPNRRRTYATAIINDTLWLGRNEGLFYGNISDLQNYQEQQSTIFSGAVQDLSISKNLKLWVAMEGKGLFRFDGVKVDTIVELYKNERIISKLSSDTEGNLWIGSNRGVYQINTISDVPFEYEITKYSLAEGLPSREIKQILVKDSSIYVLTHKGLSILNSKQPDFLPKTANLVFTNLKINNTESPFQSIITLPYHQNNITFEYALLAYEDLQEIQYEYRMEGIDQEWQHTEATLRTYNTLTPGEYVFRLKAIDRSGQYSEEQKIELTILPPWWQTYGAYFSYLLFIIGLGYFLIRQYISRQLAQQEVMKMKELSEQKNRFFASITHEFRTPLTVIDGMAAKIKANGEAKYREAADVILKHETKLLHLVNQILDLAKLQEGELKSEVVQKDLIEFIRNTLQPFYEFATLQSIDLSFDSDLEHLVMDFDPKALQSILLNLLSNALKFTPENGQIKVNLQVISKSKKSTERTLRLTVSDNGQGIAKKDLPFIFQRFYQGKASSHSNFSPGTGIGLTLAKELIEKFSGKIEVKSPVGKGTQFQVYLPITNNAIVIEEMGIDNSFNQKVSAILKAHKAPLTQSLDLASQSLRPVDTLPQLLIIEDDLDMVAYLHRILNSQYQIQAAKTGEEGLKLALDIMPDLIISDVLLPKKDGFELCQVLKNDTRTSHIPIVMLTAKASLESKIEGLSRGADAYLTKPFVKEELFIRLKKLLELRLKLQKRYKYSPTTISGSIPKDSSFQKEDLFIDKIKTFIEENIDNADLDVAQICRHIGMSRTHLHKKMTAITGVSITKFIRKTRLEKAAYLLRTSGLPIAQIADQTGLNPKHFSQNFKEVYEVTPRNYRKEKST